MNRKVIARVYGVIGLMITTILAILLRILSADPIQSMTMIGWTVVGLAIGLITLFVAINLYRIREGVTSSSQFVTRPIIRDVLAAAVLTILISMLLLAIYEEQYAQQLIQNYSPFIFFAVAVAHFLLNYIARNSRGRTPLT